MGPYILFAFAAIGLTTIIVESKLFMPIRDWAEKNKPWLHSLMICYQCSGFWAGLFVYPFILGFNWGWAGAGFASSILSVLTAAFLNYLEANTVITLPAEKPPEKPADGKGQ